MANDSRRIKRKMEKDYKLIKNLKNEKDNDSLKELINRHSGIYVDMVNKYIPENMEGVSKNDILDEKDLSIYDAALNFDETKNTKFSTYIGNLTRWKCLNIYNKNKKFPKEPISEISKNAVCDSDLTFLEKQESIERINSAIDKLPDERAKIIFNMRYSGGKKLTPWKKIAKKLDLSIQGCINIHNKNLTEIKRYV